MCRKVAEWRVVGGGLLYKVRRRASVGCNRRYRGSRIEGDSIGVIRLLAKTRSGQMYVSGRCI